MNEIDYESQVKRLADALEIARIRDRRSREALLCALQFIEDEGRGTLTYTETVEAIREALS